MSTVYVGNLAWHTTDESLRSRFSEYGIIVMRDRDTGRSRGFGFVTYSSSDEANNVIGALHEKEIDGNRVKVNMAYVRVAGGGDGGYAGGKAVAVEDIHREEHTAVVNPKEGRVEAAKATDL
ncbi:hypothetical protein FGADI_7113 [Fusarium gaditjirri]|uniref:RRM domain-containing protein n=1 Tax=Fusarium gaditjirri TaxID=282569 RepID=A0A8H4T5W4_9HYPO|nr:hypothetical protein FGADI_7113 [Fusarium gaditjirri]